MRPVRFACLAIILATAGCGFGEPNVYALSQAEAIDRLVGVEVESSGSGPFFVQDFRASRIGSDRVMWYLGEASTRGCELTVTPVEAESSRIDISCDVPGEGAAEGLYNNMIRKRAIELVDATLEGRPFDQQLAQGATAGRWPADRVDHGDLGDAIGKAKQMESDTQQALDEMESDNRKAGDWGDSN